MYLVLEVDGRIEVRNLGVNRFAEHLVLDVVDERAHFLCILAAIFLNNLCARTENLIWRSKG